VISALALILQLLLVNTAGAAPPQLQPVTPSSLLSVPLRIPLGQFFGDLEEMLPQQAGNWRTWRRRHGVNTKFRAWRGPLSVHFEGDVLTLRAHVRYWVKVNKRLLGAIDINSSCGVNEAPRQAVVGVQLRLEFGGGRLLQPRYRPLPTQFLDRCTMTVAAVDVTPFIERALQQQLMQTLEAAVGRLQPQLEAVREQTRQNWSQLQRPIELGDDYRLLLHPRGYALSLPVWRDQQLELMLGVALRPEILTATRPPPQETPMPPPARLPPHQGSGLRLLVALNFAALGERLSSELHGQGFEFNNGSIAIERVEITAEGERLGMLVELAGAAAGDLFLAAKLVFDPAAQQLQLENLTYDVAGNALLPDQQAPLLYELVRQTLEDAANRQLQQLQDRWQQQIAALLAGMTAEFAALDLSSLQFENIHINLHQQGVEIDAEISGAAVLTLRQE
jgi:hypothetical protein